MNERNWESDCLKCANMTPVDGTQYTPRRGRCDAKFTAPAWVVDDNYMDLDAPPTRSYDCLLFVERVTREQRIEKAAREAYDFLLKVEDAKDVRLSLFRAIHSSDPAPPAPSEPTEEEMRCVVMKAGWIQRGRLFDLWPRSSLSYLGISLKAAYEHATRERGGK